jgi:hypothetical protein
MTPGRRGFDDHHSDVRGLRWRADCSQTGAHDNWCADYAGSRGRSSDSRLSFQLSLVVPRHGGVRKPMSS